MLSEEALVVVVAFGVAAVLVVALLEAIWPTRGRPRRRSARRSSPRPRRAPSAARPRGAPSLPASPPGGRPRLETRGRTAPEPVVAEELAPASFDDCFRLYQDGRYEDALARATAALRGLPAEPPGARHEVAALWSLVGLSKQALGDDDGARAGFEAAIHAAPASERPGYEQRLGALAVTAGRKLMARAEAVSESAGEERVAALRSAAGWLQRALAVTPDDPRVASALARSRASLWTAYAQLASGLAHRQEFLGARRVIREALADPECPEDRRGTFRELLAATFSGEVGQLTAHAIRVMQEAHEREALASLERAEALLASIPEETLTPKRREEVSRRIWWGYTKLGVRRLESGAVEDAVEPLFHALRFGVDVERQRETRAALARALDGVADVRTASIDQLLRQGRRQAAAEQGDRLRLLLREGLKVGLSRKDLTQALTKVRRVLDQVEPIP